MEKSNFRLDGSESVNNVTTATGATWTRASRANWVNSALVITTTTTTDTGAQWEWMQVYLRDPQGNLSVTTIDGVVNDANAMSASTILYDRVRTARNPSQ